MKFKYYINPAECRGWEVTNDDGEVLGCYATEAEAHAAVTGFIHDDREEALENAEANRADYIIDRRKHER